MNLNKPEYAASPIAEKMLKWVQGALYVNIVR